MAGRITVSTLNDDTGVLATQNGMTGIAKAWINFNMGSGAIRGSFNVSSITFNGGGDYTINFTTAMPNANYATVATGNFSSSNGNYSIYDTASGGANPTTTAVRLRATSNAIVINITFANVAIFSS